MGNLASDLDNPEFVGARNPDELLHVEFYFEEPIDKWASEEATSNAGKKIVVKGQKIPFIMISRPGDKTTEIRRAAVEMDKARFPRHWLAFQINEGLISQGGQIPGWSIDEWSELSQDQKRELKYLRFQVVEQIAGASDAQVQQLGLGGLGLREKAKQALRDKMGSEVKDAIKAKDEQIASLQKQMDELKNMLTSRETPLETLLETPLTEVQTPKKKGGRPKGSKNKPKEVM